MLAAEIMNLGLEMGEAAGEQRERECGLWVTPNTFSRAERCASTNLCGYLYLTLAFPSLQQEWGEPPVLQQQAYCRHKAG